MNTYRIIIRYKGTSFSGWQIQPSEKTVQGELNKVIEKISKSPDIRTLGSGRTDAGVHALGQVVKIETPLKIGGLEFLKGMNSLLPKDIEVLEVEDCDESFNPVRDALSKEYIYLFSMGESLSLFHREYVASAPKHLDLEKMKLSAKYFVGHHDFADFQCVGTEVSTTKREIFECSIDRFEKNWGIFPTQDDIFAMRVKGEGFLKQMVRLMMGSLFQLGAAKIEEEKLIEALASPTGQKLGPVAPPQGLYLNKVFYP